MDILNGNEIKKAIGLFERFRSNQPVIHSVFENQFNGCVYVNNAGSIDWAVLQTPFLQHFIAGNPTDECANEIENILFNIILQEQSEKEIAVFFDIEKWDNILKTIFQKHNGVTDVRKIFNFSSENYYNAKRKTELEGITPVLEKCKNLPFSHIESWSAKLLIGSEPVSYCNAIMIGKKQAEIDIFTNEAFRGKGYATITAFMLIDKLLEEGLTPTWSTWPFRVESRHIAQKLGFIPAPDVKAWIWQEGM